MLTLPEFHRRFIRIAVLLALFPLLASAARAAETAPERTVPLGLCEDYPQATRSLEHARHDLEAAHRAGAQVLRVAFSWCEMEDTRGKIDFSFWDDFVRMATDEFHLRLIPYVCYTPRWAASDHGPDFWKSAPRDPHDFARFVTALVDHYKGSIHSWELWNEPDNRDFWTGSIAAYAGLVRAGSQAVRAADPTAQVVLGGLAGHPDYLRQLFGKEGLSPFVDVVNVHCYYETWDRTAIEHLPVLIDQVQQIITQAGRGQTLWMAEMGYSSYRASDGRISHDYRARFPFEHSAAYQGEALLRMITLALSTGKISLLAWYRINDLPVGSDVIGDVNNCHLGLLDNARRDKPALRSFQTAVRLFAGPFRCLDDSTRVTNAPPGAEIHAFANAAGHVFVLAWLGLQAPASTVLTNQRLPLTLTFPARIFTSATASPLDGVPMPAELTSSAGQTVLHLLPLSRQHLLIYELK